MIKLKPCKVCGDSTKPRYRSSLTCGRECLCKLRSINSTGVNNPRYGAVLTPEHIHILSETHRGRPVSAEQRLNQSIRFSGENHSMYGKKFSEDSKQKMSASHKLRWANYSPEERRIMNDKIIQNSTTGGKCKWFTIAGLRVQGRYELAYIQNILDKGLQLPNSHTEWIQTPYGKYLPDFEYSDHFVEVKSPYTLKSMVTGGQHRKIKWVSKHHKLVKIVVLKPTKVDEILKSARRQESLEYPSRFKPQGGLCGPKVRNRPTKPRKLQTGGLKRLGWTPLNGSPQPQPRTITPTINSPVTNTPKMSNITKQALISSFTLQKRLLALPTQGNTSASQLTLLKELSLGVVLDGYVGHIPVDKYLADLISGIVHLIKLRKQDNPANKPTDALPAEYHPTEYFKMSDSFGIRKVNGIAKGELKRPAAIQELHDDVNAAQDFYDSVGNPGGAQIHTPYPPTEPLLEFPHGDKVRVLAGPPDNRPTTVPQYDLGHYHYDPESDRLWQYEYQLHTGYLWLAQTKDFPTAYLSKVRAAWLAANPQAVAPMSLAQAHAELQRIMVEYDIAGAIAETEADRIFLREMMEVHRNRESHQLLKPLTKVWIVEGHYEYESNICSVYANEQEATKGIAVLKESTDYEYTRYSTREHQVVGTAATATPPPVPAPVDYMSIEVIRERVAFELAAVGLHRLVQYDLVLRRKGVMAMAHPDVTAQLGRALYLAGYTIKPKEGSKFTGLLIKKYKPERWGEPAK